MRAVRSPIRLERMKLYPFLEGGAICGQAVICDIGGTRTRVAYSERLEIFEEPVVFETPARFADACALIASNARAVAKSRLISRAIFGLPGVYDREAGSLFWSPNLPQWIGESFGKEMAETLGVPCTVANDADLAGLGEAVFGAGKGSASVAYMTISTGVGGTRILNGTIDAAVEGFEPGRQIIDATSGDTLEDRIGGNAFSKRFGQLPYTIIDPVVWSEAAGDLSIGLYNSIMLWSPETLVLGGPMIAGSPAIPFDVVVEKTKALVSKVFVRMPEIKRAELGDIAGLYGGMQYLRDWR